MNILIAVDNVRFIELHPQQVDPQLTIAPGRTYYQAGPTMPPGIIVCQNNITLSDAIGHIVECLTTVDRAMRPFTADWMSDSGDFVSAVDLVNQARPKITMLRITTVLVTGAPTLSGEME